MAGGAVISSGPVAGDKNVLSKANRRPMIYCAIAVLGAVLYGYDGTYFAGILEMERFRRDYGALRERPNGTIGYDITSGERSLLASIVQAGELVGALTSAFIGDYFGRKGGFAGAGALVMIGTAIQMAPGSIGALAGGRAILGMGVGVISATTSPYLAEVAPSSIRGPVVSSWQLLLAIGQVVGNGVAQGTRNLDSTWAYGIPIILNLAIAGIMVAGVLLVCPESPRWLMSKGRDEQAMASLRKINAGQADPEEVVELEFKSFAQARDDERATQGDGGWKALFATKQDRRRLLMVFGVLVSQQIGGVQFIFSYATTFFAAIGITASFTISMVVAVVEVFGVLVSFLLVNRFGRRPLLLWTSVPMILNLLICGILGSIDPNNENAAIGRAIAAQIILFVFFFNLAWGPLAWVCASELSSGGQKTRVMAVGTAGFWIIAFLVTFTLPYLFDDAEAGLGPQVGYIYAGLQVVAMAFVYFYIPETLGRSLEDIQVLISHNVPTRQWKDYNLAKHEGISFAQDRSEMESEHAKKAQATKLAMEDA